MLSCLSHVMRCIQDPVWHRIWALKAKAFSFVIYNYTCTDTFLKITRRCNLTHYQQFSFTVWHLLCSFFPDKDLKSLPVYTSFKTTNEVTHVLTLWNCLRFMLNLDYHYVKFQFPFRSGCSDTQPASPWVQVWNLSVKEHEGGHLMLSVNFCQI